MFFLIVLISWLFFSKYFNEDNTNVSQNTSTTKVKVQDTGSTNLIDNISYTSTDLKGNRYKITAQQAVIDINNKDIMFLENVVAYAYMKNSNTIKIISDFGKYNSKNYDTIFSRNVIVTYPDHKITGDYLDFSLLNGLGTMSTNIIYSSNKTNVVADMMEIDLSTKNSKIFMNDNKKKVIIKGIR
jgi:LPS export ABC transporter protein LptC